MSRLRVPLLPEILHGYTHGMQITFILIAKDTLKRT